MSESTQRALQHRTTKQEHACWMGPGADASSAPVTGRAGVGGGKVEAELAAVFEPTVEPWPNFCASDTGGGKANMIRETLAYFACKRAPYATKAHTLRLRWGTGRICGQMRTLSNPMVLLEHHTFFESTASRTVSLCRDGIRLLSSWVSEGQMDYGSCRPRHVLHLLRKINLQQSFSGIHRQGRKHAKSPGRSAHMWLERARMHAGMQVQLMCAHHVADRHGSDRHPVYCRQLVP